MQTMTTIHATNGGCISFLSDRWGDLAQVASQPSKPDRFETAQTTREAVSAYLATHAHAFQDEACFLVHVRPGLAVEGLALFIEFELDQDLLPEEIDEEADDEARAALASAWRDAVGIFCPALVHAGKAAREVEEAGGQAAMVMTFMGDYGASIGMLLSLESASHYRAAFEALFLNGLPFPPSAHARLAAMRQLAWTTEPDDIDPAWLPGARAATTIRG